MLKMACVRWSVAAILLCLLTSGHSASADRLVLPLSSTSLTHLSPGKLMVPEHHLEQVQVKQQANTTSPTPRPSLFPDKKDPASLLHLSRGRRQAASAPDHHQSAHQARLLSPCRGQVGISPGRVASGSYGPCSWQYYLQTSTRVRPRPSTQLSYNVHPNSLAYLLHYVHNQRGNLYDNYGVDAAPTEEDDLADDYYDDYSSEISSGGRSGRGGRSHRGGKSHRHHGGKSHKHSGRRSHRGGKSHRHRGGRSHRHRGGKRGSGGRSWEKRYGRRGHSRHHHKGGKRGSRHRGRRDVAGTDVFSAELE